MVELREGCNHMTWYVYSSRGTMNSADKAQPMRCRVLYDMWDKVEGMRLSMVQR
jgi:hypothetical protein